MTSVYDHLLDSYYRISQTVPLCEEAAKLFLHNKEFWLTSADEERGHDDLLLTELVAAFGNSVLTDIVSHNISPKIEALLSWVNQKEINHLAYKYLLESTILSPELKASRDFYRQFIPKFIALHEEADKHHSKVVAEKLCGTDISNETAFILECLK